MADFDNIKGWHEELLEHQSSEAYLAENRRQKSAEEMSAPRPKVPFSNLLELAELILCHPEIRACLDKLRHWNEEHPGESPGDHEDTYPAAALSKINDFKAWYRLKTGLDWNHRGFSVATQLSAAVSGGKLSSIQSSEAETFVRNSGERYINFDK